MPILVVRLKGSFVILAALVVATLIGGLAAPFAERARPVMATQAPPQARAGHPAPDFTLESLYGGPVSLANYQGKPVLLYFWATWCGYCRGEMPRLEQAFREHQDDGLVVLAVNLLEQAPDVEAYVEQGGYSFPVVLDSKAAVAGQYTVRAVPTSFFIDRDGTIARQVIGSITDDVFQGHLQLILPSGDADSPRSAG